MTDYLNEITVYCRKIKVIPFDQSVSLLIALKRFHFLNIFQEDFSLSFVVHCESEMMIKSRSFVYSVHCQSKFLTFSYFFWIQWICQMRNSFKRNARADVSILLLFLESKQIHSIISHVWSIEFSVFN